MVTLFWKGSGCYMCIKNEYWFNVCACVTELSWTSDIIKHIIIDYHKQRSCMIFFFKERYRRVVSKMYLYCVYSHRMQNGTSKSVISFLPVKSVVWKVWTFYCKHLKIERMQELVFFATWYSHPNYSFQHQAWYLSSFLFTKALTDIKKPNMNSYLLPMLATFLSSWLPPSTFFVAFFIFLWCPCIFRVDTFLDCWTIKGQEYIIIIISFFF